MAAAKEPRVRIDDDDMRAFLCIQEELKNDYNNEAVIYQFLKEKGVNYGIIEENLKELLEKQLYNHEIVIAQGLQPENGVDGYYEYKF